MGRMLPPACAWPHCRGLMVLETDTDGRGSYRALRYLCLSCGREPLVRTVDAGEHPRARTMAERDRIVARRGHHRGASYGGG